MSVHYDLNAVWHTCETVDCALPLHMDIPLAEAESLPEHMFEAILLAAHAPTRIGRMTKIDGGGVTPGIPVQIWEDAAGRRHRDYDLPAMIHGDGTRTWYRHGKRHRDNDRPAVIHADGRQEWFVNGERHRDNGLPAIVWPGGRQHYWEHGKRIIDGA